MKNFWIAGFFLPAINATVFKMPNGINFRLLSEKLGDITR